ncbi:MAG: methyltransferase, CheR-type [Verrucomicrobiales bacterium]|nr:methyltransferase, CheR-type [Verrucomicrobiales bacterium]
MQTRIVDPPDEGENVAGQPKGNALVVPPAQELEDIEFRLLLDAIISYYGFNFRDYTSPAFRGKVRSFMAKENIAHVSGLIERLLHSSSSFEKFLYLLSDKPDILFNHPAYITAFRTIVVPILRTYPYLRFWLPCCGRGEEAYSLAILLKEEGLYERSTLYATDISETMLAEAQAGEFDAALIPLLQKNYAAGGYKKSFEDYYEVVRGRLIMPPELKKNIFFAQHNLATDGSFNEFHVIICREKMKDLSEILQRRIQCLFRDSLVRLGVLWTGATDHLGPLGCQDDYHELGETLKIFRKLR